MRGFLIYLETFLAIPIS